MIHELIVKNDYFGGDPVEVNMSDLQVARMNVIYYQDYPTPVPPPQSLQFIQCFDPNRYRVNSK